MAGRREILWAIIAFGGVALSVAGIVLMVNGEPISWLTTDDFPSQWTRS
ncbi:hypothetical protein V8Z69_18215 [Microbacterium aurugineum]|nr:MULTISPECIES: hypothetical protein [Microbacterium]